MNHECFIAVKAGRGEALITIERQSPSIRALTDCGLMQIFRFEIPPTTPLSPHNFSISSQPHVMNGRIGLVNYNLSQ